MEINSEIEINFKYIKVTYTDMDIYKKGTLLDFFIKMSKVIIEIIKVVKKNPEIANIPFGMDFFKPAEVNNYDKFARAFKHVDLRNIAYIQLDGDLINVYSYQHGTNELQHDKVFFLGLNTAVEFLSAYGIVRINRQEAINVYSSTFDEERTVIYINDKISLEVTNSNLNDVIEAFKRAKKGK